MLNFAQKESFHLFNSRRWTETKQNEILPQSSGALGRKKGKNGEGI